MIISSGCTFHLEKAMLSSGIQTQLLVLLDSFPLLDRCEKKREKLQWPVSDQVGHSED